MLASGWRTRRPVALRTADEALHTSRTRSITATNAATLDEVGARRPVGQVHAGLVADEAAVHGFGRQRQQRRGDLAQRRQHRPQHVECLGSPAQNRSRDRRTYQLVSTSRNVRTAPHAANRSYASIAAVTSVTRACSLPRMY